MNYQPGARILIGYSGTAANPPSTYTSDATVALQEAVRDLGKDWQRVSGVFVVAPAANSDKVVVGISLSRVPCIFPEPRRLGPKTAWTRAHYVTQAGWRAPDVGQYSPPAVNGILDAWNAASEDPRIASLGIELEKTDQPEYFLLSDDGRDAALVYGQVLWKLGATYEDETIRTWTYDYGDGEAARLIGVPYAEVNSDLPIVQIEGDFITRSDFEKSAKEAVEVLLETPAPWNWEMVCEQDPEDLEPVVPTDQSEPASIPELSDSFSPRSFKRCSEVASTVGGGFLSQVDEGFDLSAEEVVRAAQSADPDAIDTWNARVSGSFAAGDEWAVADLSFVQEQAEDGDSLDLILALFRVEEGWVVAVWPGFQNKKVASVLGFDPWPTSSWTECEFWFGE